MILVLVDPQSENCHIDSDFNGGIQTTRLLVVKVPADLGVGLT